MGIAAHQLGEQGNGAAGHQPDHQTDIVTRNTFDLETTHLQMHLRNPQQVDTRPKAGSRKGKQDLHLQHLRCNMQHRHRDHRDRHQNQHQYEQVNQMPECRRPEIIAKINAAAR